MIFVAVVRSSEAVLALYKTLNAEKCNVKSASCELETMELDPWCLLSLLAGAKCHVFHSANLKTMFFYENTSR